MGNPINFIVLMAKKFGPGHMFQIIMGRYHKPSTENRIFMFLDLKDSTTIAEKLGHIIYSKLLQQCFFDLNKLIPNSRAEIYQYVGDEAVLTWKIKNSNPISLDQYNSSLHLKRNWVKEKNTTNTNLVFYPSSKLV